MGKKGRRVEDPLVKTTFCECCLEEREKSEFVGRLVRTTKEKPVRFRICYACNSYSDEDFYGNLTRKLINRILKSND